jgi:amidophosphoribosyltransferase
MLKDDKIHEECAVFGACLTVPEAAGIAYNGLLTLQHRGQESAGIALVDDHKIICTKGIGLVSEVFSSEALASLPACCVAVGHTRYSTTGSSIKENAAPFVTEYLTGRIAVAHNGNITNAQQIRNELATLGIQFHSTSDSEVVSALIAYHITQETDITNGIAKAAAKLEGAFSLIIASGNDDLILVRDPHGYRPLCFGKSAAGYVAASESCVFDTCGFAFQRDVMPGEIIVLRNGEITHQGISSLNKQKPGAGLCIFEYVYFARPDSVIDGLSVYKARFNMGMVLAEEHPAEADVVCGVPDSGLDAASGYSARSGIPLVSGFVKNRYIGRSFIYPTQTQRDSAVRLKLNPLTESVYGKRVVLVDDSIVRGTTIAKLIGNLKNAGAAKVHLRISSPPFRHTCHYGTDIDDADLLIANQVAIPEICKMIGADSLGYISLDGLIQACRQCRLPFCTTCFSGEENGVQTKKNIFE